MRFHVLGSGSAGNASLLTAGGFGVLIDLGFGPRALDQRLDAVGASWQHVHAAVLTHIHNDHWNEHAFRCLVRMRVPLYCHPVHVESLRRQSESFQQLLDAGLVRCYRVNAPSHLGNDMTCRPLSLKHDGHPTCGFRFEWNGRALAYATDLGSWNASLVASLTDVDLLALEFNHDEDMERDSGRAAFLVRRVLGARGHLSNDQAAELLESVLRDSLPGRLQHLVLLHMSRECNRPDLAQAAALRVRESNAGTFQVHTASQHQPGPSLEVQRSALACAAEEAERQLLLPGWD
ncbi:MAG: MBL fold metallo-hydrolase [Planctomycetes bacterium]|nr:MBL fold metallo-hydrolase [Planctomycetota bacterium]